MQPTRLAPGEHVEIHVEGGDVVDATILRLRSRASPAVKVSTRSKAWPRWCGTTQDLMSFVRQAEGVIAARSSGTPPISINVALRDGGAENYFDVAEFERELRAGRSQLAQIESIEMTIGPAASGMLVVHAKFRRALPSAGVLLLVEGSDSTEVTGVREQLAAAIDSGRPRISSLPSWLIFGIFFAVGVGYSIGLNQIDWGFLPSGTFGDILFVGLYGVSYGALLFGLVWGIKKVMDPLRLVRPAERRRTRDRFRRALGVTATVVGLVTPFVLFAFDKWM